MVDFFGMFAPMEIGYGPNFRAGKKATVTKPERSPIWPGAARQQLLNTALDDPAQRGRAPAGVMAASNRGVRPRQQPAPLPHLLRLRHRRARASRRAPVAEPVRSGLIPRARCTTAPALAGTARPNRAAICRRRRRKRRAPARTTGRLAARRSCRKLAFTFLYVISTAIII